MLGVVLSPDDLARMPLFAQLTSESRSTLAGRLTVEEFTPGQQMVAQGESGFSVFVIADGRAVATQHDKHLGYLGVGDYFGETAVLTGDGLRTATVTAVTPVVAWVMFGATFTALQHSEPQVATELQRVMNERLGDRSW